ncbi:putative fatty acyl-CoA reductase CG5065 [Anoplophora glabripennis]|uniref:putative fatty acyl-CoA reductase CG5065 n=1 Tax=Anoplophora glabripennis TaxID=217634 RepID=UPI0008759A2E|nr:putative fatty acyl-CoA reductase CG5065 [Anoplophora glabripennis]
MSDEDKKIFYCDVKDFDWEESLEYYTLGLRIYLMKDPLETLPAGQKLRVRLYWLHQLTKTVIVIFLLWTVWVIFSFIFRLVF